DKVAQSWATQVVGTGPGLMKHHQLYQCGGQATPLFTRELPRVGSQSLNANVIRPSLFVFIYALHDGVLVAPRDDRVEEPVTDRVKVVLREASAQQVVGIVRQAQIGTQPIGSDGPCVVTAVGEEDGLFGKQQRSCAQHVSGLARVVGRDQVWMRATGT